MNDYIVYEVLYCGKPVYYGEGKRGRENHVKSGKSSSVELNRLFFTDPDNMVVNVIRENLTKQEAKELEKEYIHAIQPRCNIKMVPRKNARFYT